MASSIHCSCSKNWSNGVIILTNAFKITAAMGKEYRKLHIGLKTSATSLLVQLFCWNTSHGHTYFKGNGTEQSYYVLRSKERRYLWASLLTTAELGESAAGWEHQTFIPSGLKQNLKPHYITGPPKTPWWFCSVAWQPPTSGFDDQGASTGPSDTMSSDMKPKHCSHSLTRMDLVWSLLP